MEKIRIGDSEFEVIVKKKAMRSVRLRLREKNKIEMSVPWLTPMIFVKKFLNDNSEWILKQNEKLSHKKTLSNIKKIEILGESYEVETKKSLRDSLVIMDKKIYVNYSEKNKIKEIIDKKMRTTALKLIKENTKRLAQKFNLHYEKVNVKNQSSRFGSCSHGDSLNFNWQIILFPVPIFEHIILHELTHLTIKNHSKSFWELLGNYDSNWRENNQWLKKEGTKRFIV
ncbi:MAG: SprT family zinc-dependent metalloprotease [Candidatus Shapirobacteria bacterium]